MYFKNVMDQDVDSILDGIAFYFIILKQKLIL